MANEGYSILDVINDEYGVILTRNGCVSVAFRMYNPECYSLHRTDLEERNARLYQAFKHLPSGSFVHKQDVFLKREYVHELEGDSFIDKAEQRHFSGREYLEHDCLLIFTLSGLSTFFLGCSIGIIDALQDGILPKLLLYTQDSFLTSAFLLSFFQVSFPLSF